MLARDELDGAKGDMRARFMAVSGDIAEALARLVRTASQGPLHVPASVLTAAAQIAATEERLCADWDRLPAMGDARMHSLLQAQYGTLLQLDQFVEQHARAQSHAGVSGPYCAPLHAAATFNASIADVDGLRPWWHRTPSRALPPSLPSPGQGTWREPVLSYPTRLGGRPTTRRQVPPQTSKVDRLRARGRLALVLAPAVVLVKAMASLSLVLMVMVGTGLLVAYGTFPRAGDHLELASKPALADGARPVPPAEMARSASVEASPPVPIATPPEPTPAKVADIVVAPAPAPTAVSPATSQLEIAVDPAGPAIGSARQVATAALYATPATMAKMEKTTADNATAKPAVAPQVRAVEGFVPVLFTHQEHATAGLAFLDLQRRYPNLLGHRQVEVQSVDVGRRGVWHRLVVLPPAPRQQASTLCNQLLAAGYDRCWVKAY